MLKLVSAASARSPRAEAAPPGAAATERLLGFAGPVAGLHALILAAGPPGAGEGPELLCGLIRRGCAAATALRGLGPVDAGAYDLVLLTGLAAPDGASAGTPADAVALIRLARRALLPSGGLVARVALAEGAPANGGAAVPLLVRLLRLNGFTTTRTRLVPGAVLLRADLPAFAAATGMPGSPWSQPAARRA